MDYKAKTLEELATKAGKIGNFNALVGLDGFVDKLMTPVKSRHGQGENFEPIELIDDMGKRISAAAGKSTNIELFPKMEKLGGNGPIMANAVLCGGIPTRYIGALGETEIHPIFKDFAEKTNAVSVADPGITHALEFKDGKIMLGTMASMDTITYQAILDKMGEGAFIDTLSRSDLVAMTNWTMIPNMTAIFHAIVDKVLPNLGPREQRVFFFDLADPEKRSDSDIHGALKAIQRYQSYGHVTLGLNLKEGQHIFALLGNAPIESDAEGLKRMALRICQQLEIGTVVIHPTAGAACANRSEAFYVDGPYCEAPLITTGAGDHFNAGFTTAQVLGLSLPACLTVAVCYSGSYVRSAKSPSINDIDTFIRNWQ